MNRPHFTCSRGFLFACAVQFASGIVVGKCLKCFASVDMACRVSVADEIPVRSHRKWYMFILKKNNVCRTKASEKHFVLFWKLKHWWRNRRSRVCQCFFLAEIPVSSPGKLFISQPCSSAYCIRCFIQYRQGYKQWSFFSKLNTIFFWILCS